MGRKARSLNTSGGHTFQNALQVSEEQIKPLGDVELRDLMKLLFRAEDSLSGGEKAVVSYELKAADDGCDAFSYASQKPSTWFSDVDTCWQLKSGVSGEPTRLKGEVSKKLPRETLMRGGRYVVVTSGCLSGHSGAEKRLKILKKEAIKEGIPTDRIEVYTAGELCNWINSRPSVAAICNSVPNGIFLVEKWAMDALHQGPYEPSDSLKKVMSEQRNALAAEGSCYHLHIHGQAGAGKTRFCLELCRGAGWSDLVIMFTNGGDTRLIDVMGGVVHNLDTVLTIVVDEAQDDDVRLIQEYVNKAEGRLRVISIGITQAPIAEVESVEIPILDQNSMRRILFSRFPSLPREHCDYAVAFAAGYVKLAILVARALTRDKSLSSTSIFNIEYVRKVLTSMLAESDTASLYVVAVLTYVGWEGEAAVEGQTIAKVLGMDWMNVKRQVHATHQSLKIAPQGGPYRYISPHPLGAFLASEVWDQHHDELQELAEKLPSQSAKDRYLKRLLQVSDKPSASRVAIEILETYTEFADFTSESDALTWSRCATSMPVNAAATIRKVLQEASSGQRMLLSQATNRHLTLGIVELCRFASAFDDAGMALAELALFKNSGAKSPAENAFLERFQVVLSGTPIPYLTRLKRLDELLSRTPAYQQLAVQAIARVGLLQCTNTFVAKPSHSPSELEWNPNVAVNIDARVAGLSLLTQHIPLLSDGLEETVGAAAKECVPLMRFDEFRIEVETLITAAVQRYPSQGEPLRRAVQDERVIMGPKLSTSAIADLERLSTQLEDPSYSGRLLQYVGTPRQQTENETRCIIELAKEAVANPSLLTENWAWLTSRDATHGWAFGTALAEADQSDVMADIVVASESRGEDVRVAAGYFASKGKSLGPDRVDEYLEGVHDSQSEEASFVFELLWRSSGTDRALKRLAIILRERNLNTNVVGGISYSRLWDSGRDVKLLIEVVEALIADERYVLHAPACLSRLMKAQPTLAAQLRDLAEALATDIRVIRCRSIDYDWNELAIELLPCSAGKLIQAIVDAHSHRISPSWSVRYQHYANSVAWECAKIAPEATWEAIAPRLSEAFDAQDFILGFPTGLIDLVARGPLLSWVNEKPDERAPLIARLASNSLADTDGLGSELLERFEGQAAVGDSLYSSFIKGVWSGPASQNWLRLAKVLEAIAENAKPATKKWALASADSLRRQASRELSEEAVRNLPS